MAKVKNPYFLAIGVGQGDAFFLNKAGYSALIDGGRSMHGFPSQFQKVTNRTAVDILVCTHNDADHTLGIIGFLRSGLACNEVWLPGSWTDRLHDLLLRPYRFTEELVSNIKEEMEIEKIGMSSERRLSLQTLGDQYFERIKQQNEDSRDVASTEVLSEALEGTTEGELYPEVPWLYPPLWSTEYGPDCLYLFWEPLCGDTKRFQIFIDAINAATRIREISLAAYHTGALIRWFEFDTIPASGGVRGFLEPLNAHEILQIRRNRWKALEYLALTTSNEQSLVFLSPANNDEPAALFTADSNLRFSQPINWSEGMIITAPHHGSENNAYAYERFSKEVNNDHHVVWVTSDGRFKARPGSSYIKAYGSHFCTLCRGSNTIKQDVRFIVDSGKWKPESMRKCCCDGKTLN